MSVARHCTPGGATNSRVERNSDVVSAKPGAAVSGDRVQLGECSLALRKTWRIRRDRDHACEEAPEKGRYEVEPRREQEHRAVPDSALPLERGGDRGRSPRKLGIAQLDDRTRHIARGKVAEPDGISESRRAIPHDIHERFAN